MEVSRKGYSYYFSNKSMLSTSQLVDKTWFYVKNTEKGEKNVEVMANIRTNMRNLHCEYDDKTIDKIKTMEKNIYS